MMSETTIETQVSGAENRTEREQVESKPFLRWAGGKSRIVKHLQNYLPREKFRDYWEPFLGSAALFFALGPETAHLSDSNSDLIACYKQVRDKPDLVYRYLREHLSKTSEEYYYEVRRAYNTSRPSAAQAARFIYLNRTSFNGIYRVNQKGEYNVPYGHKEPPPAPSKGDLRIASELLKNASLSAKSYDVALADNAPKAGDLVYLDPPYPPISKTSRFTHYTTSRFSLQDHKAIAVIANQLRSHGCFVMISNTDIPPIRELYPGWNMHRLPVVRWIAANGSRRKVADLVITGYSVKSEQGGLNGIPQNYQGVRN
jgi:DNA adenine methylase